MSARAIGKCYFSIAHNTKVDVQIEIDLHESDPIVQESLYIALDDRTRALANGKASRDELLEYGSAYLIGCRL